MAKNFTITKNKFKKSEKAPDYKMSIKEGDAFLEVGACWLKEGKNGEKYFSCKLSDAYVDHTKGTARKGFDLVMEGQTEKVAEYDTHTEEKVEESEIPF